MKIARPLSRFLLPLTAVSLLAGGGAARADLLPPLPGTIHSLRTISPSSHKDLHTIFRSEGYDWSTLNKGVPPLILTTLPSDLARVPRLSERKQLFFLSLLPMILVANDEISRKREELLTIFERWDNGGYMDRETHEEIAFTAREYGVEGDPLTDLEARNTLLKRVDILPPSLVLAQAANESAYGTSRFALKGNNLFGEWTFTPGKGLVPKERPAGEIYEVRRFNSLYDSIKAYLKNINTHLAYVPLRDRRAALRADGLPLQGRDLALGLTNYSVRGGAYVDEIRDIIRRNSLSLLSDVSLRPHALDAQRQGNGLFSTSRNTSRHAQFAAQGRRHLPPSR